MPGKEINIDEIMNNAKEKAEAKKAAAAELEKERQIKAALEKSDKESLVEKRKKEILNDSRWKEICDFAHNPKVVALLEEYYKRSLSDVTPNKENPFNNFSTEKSINEIWGEAGPCIEIGEVKIYFDKNDLGFEIFNTYQGDERGGLCFLTKFAGKEKFVQAMAECIYENLEICDHKNGKKITRTVIGEG